MDFINILRAEEMGIIYHEPGLLISNVSWQGFSIMAFDWLAAVLPAKWSQGWKFLLTDLDVNMEFS